MKKTIHMIGNAHLDPVWLWNWREGFQENKATFQSALDRMDEFGDFIFTSSSAQFYKWVEENAPDMFKKIKVRVKEGRWKICGGWWVQPDCNIPSGESFARQALLAQNYFLEKFGVTAHTGYCVDSFGHNAMLPQILKKSGMDNYVFMRPDPEEKVLPARAFLWESPDGSRVKAFRIPFNYGFFEDLEKNIDRCAGECSEGMDQMMCFYGVGNHGGGPTIKNIQTIHALMNERQDINVVMSDPDRYFGSIESCTLPVVKDELQHHSPGCYSAETMIKAMNRKAENALLSAEKLSVLATALGKTVATENLNLAWEDVLFNQFHDILAGSGIESAYYDARNQLGEAIAIADRCENDAVQGISFDIDIPLDPDSFPLVVFNPHSWAVKAPVEFESGMFHNSNVVFDEMCITDCQGETVPHQFIEPACRVPGRKRFTFMAEVAALGYAVFFLRKGGNKTGTDFADSFSLENERLRVEFDEKYGTISSIYDKQTGREVLSAASRVSVIEDLTDTWGHSLRKLNKEIGNFKLVSAKVLDHGDVRSSVRFISKYENSTLTQTFSLYKDDDKIRVRSKLNWQEQRKAVKLYFPVNTEQPEAVCEIPFGNIIKNREGYEEPMQRWADLSGQNGGLSVINDGKYGVDFTGSTIGITVLRSPVYAQHDPYELRDDEEYSYMDQGVNHFFYMLKPHGGDWRRAGTVNDAILFNQPLVSGFETFHKGSLPLKNSFISISESNILLSALKKSLHGDDFVLRLYESFGKATEVEINLFRAAFSAKFAPYEIKTFSLSKGGSWKEVNLIEQEVKSEG